SIAIRRIEPYRLLRARQRKRSSVLGTTSRGRTLCRVEIPEEVGVGTHHQHVAAAGEGVPVSLKAAEELEELRIPAIRFGIHARGVGIPITHDGLGLGVR